MKSTSDSSLTETELEFTRSIINGVLSTSSLTDKVSTWLLAGHGATIALIVANLDKTSLFVGVENTKMVLVLLMIASLLGIAEKYLAIRILAHLKISQKSDDALNRAIENHNKSIAENEGVSVEFDPMKTVLVIESIVPWYQRRDSRRILEGALKDPLYGHKRAAHFFNYQMMYAILQLSLSVAAIFFIAINIKPA